MAIPLNSYGNCTTDTRGSGSRSCDIKSFGDILGCVLFKKGFTLTIASDTLTETTYKNNIKAYNFFPYIGLYNFEQSTPENERATSSTGVMTPVRDGKPQFSFSYDRGGCLHKSLYDKKGKGRWDLGVLFDKGLLVALNPDETKLKGFNMGMFDVDTFKLLQGTDPQMSTAVLQLLSAMEFNMSFQFFSWAQLGFDGTVIDGVIDVNVVVSAPVAPGTTFSVSVTGECNEDDVIDTLDATTAWALGGEQTSSTTISAVVFNADTNEYDFTVSPALIATDTLQPYLKSGSYRVAEDDLGALFSGQQATVVTVT